jgi:hypothetical protein
MFTSIKCTLVTAYRLPYEPTQVREASIGSAVPAAPAPAPGLAPAHHVWRELLQYLSSRQLRPASGAKRKDLPVAFGTQQEMPVKYRLVAHGYALYSNLRRKTSCIAEFTQMYGIIFVHLSINLKTREPLGV